MKKIIIERDCNGDLFVRIPNGPIVRLECPDEDHFIILQKYLLYLIDCELLQLDLEIAKTNLSARCKNALINDCIFTIGDLIQYSKHYLLKIPNFGQFSLAEVKALLNELGLELPMNSLR